MRSWNAVAARSFVAQAPSPRTTPARVRGSEVRATLRAGRSGDGAVVRTRPSEFPRSHPFALCSAPVEFPPDDVVLALAPPELAGYMLMRVLVSWRSDQKPVSYRVILSRQRVDDPELRLAFAEAWNWLLREGLLLPDQNPNLLFESATNVVPSRTARLITDRSAFEAMRHSKLLPRHLLDQRIRLKVETHFVQGHYDEAVSLALREVEIALREATASGSEDYSTDLIKLAFHPEGGKLTDREAVKSEQESLHLMFRGMYGLYRNSTSHRIVGLGPEMSIEVFIMATHLLRIIKQRTTERAPGA